MWCEAASERHLWHLRDVARSVPPPQGPAVWPSGEGHSPAERKQLLAREDAEDRGPEGASARAGSPAARSREREGACGGSAAAPRPLPTVPGQQLPRCQTSWARCPRGRRRCRCYLKLPTWMEREASGLGGRPGASALESVRLLCTRRASWLWETQTLSPAQSPAQRLYQVGGLQ